MAEPEWIVGVFDRAADMYDAVGVPWFGPIAAGLVAELDVRPGERVLDIGCGRGAALRPLALATGPGGRAVGIDLAPRMVELTARDLAAYPQVEVVVGDAGAPGFPAASFDVVAASLVVFFLPDPAAALEAWTGLLAPGGRLGVTTVGAQDDRWRRVDDVFAPYRPRPCGCRAGPTCPAGAAAVLTPATGAAPCRRTLHRRLRARVDAVALSAPEQGR